MKTRLICLALCLLFILSAGLTGCKQKTRDDNLETIIEESSADNKTISLWLVTENELAESVKASVNQQHPLVWHLYQTQKILYF